MLGPSRRRDRGGALLIAVIVVIAVLGMTAAYLTITIAYHRATVNGQRMEHAMAIAEAGIDFAVFQMDHWTAGDPVLATATGSVSGGSFSVTISPSFDGTTRDYVLTSTGTFQGAQRTIACVVGATTSGLWRFAAFSDTRYTLDSNSYVDSYNSDPDGDPSTPPVPYKNQLTGRYRGQRYARTNGDVGSNEAIHLDSNAKVFGDAVPGPGSQVSINSNGFVMGTTTPNPERIDLPPIVLPPAAGLPALNLNVDSNASASLPSGQYHFASLTADSNSSITVTGPAVIVVDDFDADSNSRILFDTTNGPVQIYGTGRFNIDSNSKVSTLSKLPQDLQIYITTDNYTGFESSPNGDPSKPVEIDSNAKLYAAVYAPNAIVRLDSNGELFGAIVAKKLSQDSNFRIHYDEALGQLGGGPPKYTSKGWIEVPPTSVPNGGMPPSVNLGAQ